MATTDHRNTTLVRIGERVQLARQRTDLSQTDLAIRIGVSWPTISRLERGVGKSVDLDRLHEIAHVLGVPIESLLEDAA